MCFGWTKIIASLSDWSVIGLVPRASVLSVGSESLCDIEQCSLFLNDAECFERFFLLLSKNCIVYLIFCFFNFCAAYAYFVLYNTDF